MINKKEIRRIVVKVGTSTLTYDTGKINIRRLSKLAQVLSDLKNAGIEVALVTSGAIGVGVGKLGLKERPKDTPGRQAAATVGQCELMFLYDKFFGEYGNIIGQLLVTRSDFENDERKDIEQQYKKEISSEVRGNAPFEKPLKKAISADTIKKQLSKTDNYPYEITQINVNYDGTLFIPISKINELRRNLFKTLENEVNALYRNKSKKIELENSENINTANEANISFYTNNLNHLKNIDGVRRVYLEIPPQDDSLLLREDKYNLNHMISFR